ncbi:permease [soil metagenome]
MPRSPIPARFSWVSRGDVNAFFGLTIDNISNLILMTALLLGFGFPKEFVLTRMIPGTAVGVLVGDLIYTAMAIRLARRSGRRDVTAMPLGLDTPSLFGSALFILAPAFVIARGRGLDPEAAARHAWFIGVSMLLVSGLLKLACAPFSDAIRRAVPRAGLLGSLAAIALVLIGFLPLLDLVEQPVAGLVTLAVVLATLTARLELPGRIPGDLGAVLLGCLVYYGMVLAGLSPGPGTAPPLTFRVVLPLPIEAWWNWLPGAWADVAMFLPIALPLALATIVGGIDCTESASAAGDEYPTGQIIAAEGVATLVGGLFGGVIQTTPYIGHPAYKAMGARAGYTLATALFVGLAGILGYFDWIFFLIPKVVVVPILIFVSLEITSQSFHATPRRHFPALALACLPALAQLARLVLDMVDPGRPFATLPPQGRETVQLILTLSGGFLLTSLLWATALARLIDGRTRTSAATFALAGGFSLFGIIHSPLPSSPILLPWTAITRLKDQGRFAETALQTPYHWAAAYLAAAFVILLIGSFGPSRQAEA